MKSVIHKMTYDEYCLLPEDRNQYGLFDRERSSSTARGREGWSSPSFLL